MKWLLSATTDIKFHQVPDGAVRHNYLSNNKEATISSVSWRNDGMQLVIVPCRGFTEIIEFESEVRLLKTLSQVYLPNCATFQNKANTDIAIGTLSGQVLLYDIEKDCVKHRFPTCASSIFQLKYNSEDTHLVAACSNGDVLLYSDSSSTPISSYRVPKYNSVSTVCFDQTRSNILSAGSKEGDVVVWDINNKSVLCNYSAHHEFVTCAAFFSATPDLLVTSGLDHKCIFHDIRTNKTVMRVKVASSIMTFDICNFENYMGLGSQNGSILLYDTRNLKKAVSTFVGQKEKKIRHLLFQKGVSKNETLTPSKLQSRSIDPIRSGEKFHETSSDSFLIALKNLSVTRELEERSKFDEGEISNYSNLSTSLKPSKSFSFGLSSSTPISGSREHNLSASVSDVGKEVKSACVVTSMEELKSIVKETVKKEFDECKKICEEELKNHCKEIFDEMRSSILKIQLNLLMKFNAMRMSLEDSL